MEERLRPTIKGFRCPSVKTGVLKSLVYLVRFKGNYTGSMGRKSFLRRVEGNEDLQYFVSSKFTFPCKSGVLGHLPRLFHSIS